MSGQARHLAPCQVPQQDGLVAAGRGPGLIQINITAGGYGWYLGAGTPAAGQISLQTVLEHEMGHTLGLPDNGRDGDLMDIGLGLGVRRTPSALDVAALDLAFQTAGTSSSGAALAPLPAAVEQLFAQFSRSTATAPPLQPSNNLADDGRGKAIHAALPAEGNSSTAALQNGPSPLVPNGRPVPADDPGQEDVSNDLFEDPAGKLLFGR